MAIYLAVWQLATCWGYAISRRPAVVIGDRPASSQECCKEANALDAMRRTLERLAASCHGDDRPDCPILDDLEAGEQ